MSRRRMMMSFAMQGEPAPEKEYALISTGTQYIDTGFRPNNNTRVVCRVRALSNSGAMFGSRLTNISTQFCIASGSTPQQYRSDFSNSNILTGVPITNDGIFHEWDKNKNLTYLDGNLIANHSGPAFQTEFNLYVFSVNNAGSPMGPYLFSFGNFQYYDNGVLAGDYIPVVAGSTRFSPTPAPRNTFWDKVGQVYMPVSGTGDFGIEEV